MTSTEPEDHVAFEAPIGKPVALAALGLFLVLLAGLPLAVAAYPSQGLAVFDSFSGAALGADKKSIAITVTLQPIDRTLTDADIEAVSKNIVAAVEKATGGTLRA